MAGIFDDKQPGVWRRPDRFQNFVRVPLTLWQIKHQPRVWPHVWCERFPSPPTKGSNLSPSCVYNEGCQVLCGCRDLWLLCSYRPSGAPLWPQLTGGSSIERWWGMEGAEPADPRYPRYPRYPFSESEACCLSPVLGKRFAESFGMSSRSAGWLNQFWLEPFQKLVGSPSVRSVIWSPAIRTPRGGRMSLHRPDGASTNPQYVAWCCFKRCKLRISSIRQSV